MARTRVLFVCRHNNGRSRMAEAFLDRLGQGRFEAHASGTSAATAPSLVAEVMREEGFDFADTIARDVRDLLRGHTPYHYLVTTSGPDVLKDLPPLPAETRCLHWAFPDPESVTGSREQQLAAARAIRDDIRAQVIRFLHDLA